MPPRTGAALVMEAVLRQQPSRAFSTTACRAKMTVARQRMFDWLKSRQARELAQGRGPNYLGPHPDQPFPLNPLFRSQPVLTDATRELIWDKVIQRGEALKAVSAEMNVDVRRVAAVVRLKEVQRKWERDGKKQAIPYARAVMGMLPKVSYEEGQADFAFEPVNDIHVHKRTMTQLFMPVSESRHFTREDAAKAFHKTMLSADARSPQPQLIRMERAVLRGQDRKAGWADFQEATRNEEQAIARRLHRQRQADEDTMTRVQTDRCEFRFKEVSVDDAGRDGRSRKGTGWKYGAPLQDRKRGIVKIPTSVPAEPWSGH
ncbi:hypothetical protein CDD83_9402 [Cordyceps sp. RAO-2017]|nr:hypothetical protein CDD83_9402 [Cordyceps sp. RAO-2017]